MRRSFLILVLLCVVVIAGCTSDKQESLAYGTDITGAEFANTLSLQDHTGKLKKLEDFRGKAVALFFGYTHCPDVCPTTMADLASAMKLLGRRSDEVQVLFVTLDPERDSREVLEKYVPSFDHRFLGLYGSPEQVAETARNFKVFYSMQTEAGKSGYVLDHSAGVYLFDKDGKIRIYIKYGQKPAEIAHDLELLL